MQRNKGPLWNGEPLWDTTWGNTSVHALMIVGLVLSWIFAGIDHIFLGFLFLQVRMQFPRRDLNQVLLYLHARFMNYMNMDPCAHISFQLCMGSFACDDVHKIFV